MITTGSTSRPERAIATDSLLAQCLPHWITADVRDVPLFCVGDRFIPGIYLDELSQLAIAPLICKLLNLPYGENMQKVELPELNAFS